MAWWNDKEDFANAVYDTLDPVYGDGGVLEPVTVIVDPDSVGFGLRNFMFFYLLSTFSAFVAS